MNQDFQDFEEGMKKFTKQIRELSNQIISMQKRVFANFELERQRYRDIFNKFTSFHHENEHGLEYFRIEETNYAFLVFAIFPHVQIFFIETIYRIDDKTDGLALGCWDDASLKDFEEMIPTLSQRAKSEILFNLDLFQQWIK